MSSVLKLDDVDVLADVLDAARVRGYVYCRGEFSAPWSIAFTANVCHFHVIERGACWLRLDGTEARRIDAHTLFVIPRGRAYVLSDDPKAAAVPLHELANADRAGPHVVLTHGGGGAETDLVCGAFDVRGSFGSNLLSVLPEVIHVQSVGRRSDWLDAVIRLLSAELRHVGEGTGTIVARLTEIMFVQALRTWRQQRPEASTGLLGALGDAAIARALRLIHQSPGRSWTVSSLAAEVGMSRSPFASRFTTLVGTSPLAYLARWRMEIAAGLLEEHRLSLVEIAERIGYASEAAFSRGFKKEFGIAPGAYRKMRGRVPR